MTETPSTDRFLTSVENLKKALSALEVSVTTPIAEARDLSGIIKDFELVYELAWKTLKKFLEREGHQIQSAKNAFSVAYQLGYLDQEDTWLSILKDRNLTVHTYDEVFARQMVDRIRQTHIRALQDLTKFLSSQKSGETSS